MEEFAFDILIYRHTIVFILPQYEFFIISGYFYCFLYSLI